MMSRIRYIVFTFTAAVCLLYLAALPAYAAEAAEQRVYDEAGLLTIAQIEQLETQVSALRIRMNMDIVLVTTDDAGGKSSQAYADDYYDYGSFGVGSDASGALFLIDMDNREIYISTTGNMIRYLTDARVDTVLDNSFSYLGQGDYAGAMNQFLTDAASYYEKGIPGGQYNYDSETGKISVYRSIKWYEALLAIAVSAVCAGGACLGVIQSYGMKQERKQAMNSIMAYRANAKYSMAVKNDVLRDTSVSRSIIAVSSSGSSGSRSSGSSSGGRSTTHSSSSGRSHGGGGRKF